MARKIGERREDWQQHAYRTSELPEVLRSLIGTPDCYVSQNSFYKPSRTVNAVCQLRALWADLDTYKIGMNPLTALILLEGEYGRTIPEPSFEILSGRGLYLVWSMQPERDGRLPKWQAMMSHIHDKLKGYGADPLALDAARVLRVAGSVNSKSGSEVQVWQRPDAPSYCLRDLVEKWLPDLTRPKTPQPKRGRPKKVVALFTALSLQYARMRDLVTLCELREWRMTGRRELTCFLFRYWMNLYAPDPEEALRQTLELNRSFTEPLPRGEATSATRQAEKAAAGYHGGGGYRYTNAKLIKLLAITDEEQRHLKTIIGFGEKRRRLNSWKRAKRRDSDGMTQRERALRERLEALQQALRLFPGASQSKLAAHIGVTKQRVSQLLMLDK